MHRTESLARVRINELDLFSVFRLPERSRLDQDQERKLSLPNLNAGSPAAEESAISISKTRESRGHNLFDIDPMKIVGIAVASVGASVRPKQP